MLTDFPTPPPFPVPTTGIPVDASAFSVTYETSGADPTEAQFNNAEAITLEYLEQFFIDFFDFSFEGEFVALSASALTNTVGPPRIEYNLTAFFLAGEQRIPTEEEVDIVVQTALLQPSVQTLLLELRTLPADNPFSSTSTVFYTTATMAAALTTISKKAEIDVPILLIGIAFGLGALACIVTANFETITKRSRYRPIKLMFPPEDRMPYNSNIMAMMDGESAASRSFRSTRSMGRNEI
jgi:energy-converting hydrogenase Eha subunit A